MEEISAMNWGAQSLPMKRKAITSVALAVAIVTSGLSFSAQALVLGQVRVSSALGEPLRAEVPITQLSRDEVSSLQVTLASPSDYSSRGFVYNSVLSSLRVSFESTGGTTGVIRLNSTRTIQEPFLDLLVNVAWNSGSTQRNYTMLIDPPRSMLIKTPLVTDSATQVSILEGGSTGKGWQVKQGQFEAPVEGQVDTSVTPATPETATDEPGSTAGKTKPDPQPKPKPQPKPEGQYTSGTSVKVNRGQTLGNIANAFKPSDVSTEQMLAALYKANPSAFINKNINWVRAGAVLQIPDSNEIAAVTKTEARGLVSAHAREFNQYRRQAAGTTATVKSTDVGGRATGGQIEAAKTPDKTPARGDELVIAHAGTASGQSVAEQQAVETREREREITSITGDAAAILNEIKGQSTPTTAGTESAPAASGTTETAQVGTTSTEVVGGEVPPPLAVGSEGEGIKIDAGITETIPEIPAAEVKPAEVVPPPAPAPVEAIEKSFVDKILDNITIIVAAVGGLFVLGLLGVMLKRRKNAASFDDSYADDEPLETGADSFFAENHNQEEGFMLDQSSSIYAASQLDTNVDVDPVQEADVYLAYGRDEQAIEILRDALDSDPNHVPINTKLTEIYARQNDVNAFNQQAAHLKNLTAGQGDAWDRIVRLAQNIDPANPLYAMGRGSAPAASGHDEYASFDEPDTKSLNQTAGQSMGYDAADDNYADDLDISLDTSDVENFSASLDDLDTMPSDMDFDASDEGPATRLALAEEFFAIGNKTDAKEIAAEVIAQATTAEVKKRAEQLLSRIS